MKPVLLILVLLFVSSAAAAGSDFEDGLAAYERKDYATALQKFMAAATAPHPSLDQCLERSAEIAEDHLKRYAQAMCRDWAQRPARASFYLGLIYYNGEGVLEDYAQAAAWYRKAAEAGNVDAQYNLASMYFGGQGVPQDYQQAAHWYMKAAEAGKAEAQFNLGLMYDKGEGVQQNYASAVFWYRKAAEQGYAAGQLNLGLKYSKGQGLPQDRGAAVYWYRKAAEQGQEIAQFNLGVMYAQGRGVPQDDVLAHMWANLAASTGHKEAAELRDTIARHMTPHQLAEAQRLAREWRPTIGTAPDRQPEIGGNAPAASGTGFIVSRQGHVLTNHHVIEGCRTLRATSEGHKQQPTIVGTDVENDLALLQLPAPVPSVARFREGRTIRPGDRVVVVGFPLHGLLASEANVTTGTVSALASIGNDTRFLQISAPVQPGNSGGPLLDQASQVVGIVVSKLDALKIATATGDIPQNINFAINGAVAKAFLDSQSVEYEAGASSITMGAAEIGAAAKKFTLLLECRR